MTILFNILTNVMVGIATHYICKWLDERNW